MDLVFESGTTWERTIGWKDSAGTLIDTAGYTAKMHIRATVDASTVLLELSTANGLITVGRVNTGTANEYNLKFSVPPGTTGPVVDFGKGVWDLEVTDATGRLTRLLQGFCWYSPQVTHE